MPTTYPDIVGPSAIRQSIKAGSNFGGLPPKDGATVLLPTFADDMYKFAPGTEGGLFDFWDRDGMGYMFHKLDPLFLIGVELDLGNQTAWSVSIEDVDANSMVIHSGTNETSFLSGINGPVIPVVLLRGSKVKVSTTGSTQALAATIKVWHSCP